MLNKYFWQTKSKNEECEHLNSVGDVPRGLPLVDFEVGSLVAWLAAAEVVAAGRAGGPTTTHVAHLVGPSALLWPSAPKFCEVGVLVGDSVRVAPAGHFFAFARNLWFGRLPKGPDHRPNGWHVRKLGHRSPLVLSHFSHCGELLLLSRARTLLTCAFCCLLRRRAEGQPAEKGAALQRRVLGHLAIVANGAKLVSVSSRAATRSLPRWINRRPISQACAPPLRDPETLLPTTVRGMRGRRCFANFLSLSFTAQHRILSKYDWLDAQDFTKFVFNNWVVRINNVKSHKIKILFQLFEKKRVVKFSKLFKSIGSKRGFGKNVWCSKHTNYCMHCARILPCKFHTQHRIFNSNKRDYIFKFISCLSNNR